MQVNLDFADEADMVKKLRVALALQPVATALFANSPFTEGKPNGFKSYRAEIWRDTDRDRTGMLPFVFEPGMGFERYVDYALDVPMYFVYRNGRYIDVAGASFKDFMAGRLGRLPGEQPTFDDWADHLTTLFPDVRLKRFLEMRGADAGSAMRELMALPAFWTGLLYEPARMPRLSARLRLDQKRDARLCATRFRALASRRRFAAGTVDDVAAPSRCHRRAGSETPRRSRSQRRRRAQASRPARRDRGGRALAGRPAARRLCGGLARRHRAAVRDPRVLEVRVQRGRSQP